MTRGASKRRLRVRRRRKRDDLADVAADTCEAAGPEVVAEFGCCVVEAASAAGVLAALLIVPVFLLLD